MTLVVARVVEGSVRILADLKVTYEDPRKESPLSRVLKAIALSQDTAVAFAGDVETAIEAIRHARSEKEADDLDALSGALRPYTSGGHVEFLTVVPRATRARILEDFGQRFGDGLHEQRRPPVRLKRGRVCRR